MRSPRVCGVGYRFLSGHRATRIRRPPTGLRAPRSQGQSPELSADTFNLFYLFTRKRSSALQTQTPANGGSCQTAPEQGAAIPVASPNPGPTLDGHPRASTSAAAAQRTPGPAVGPAGGSPAPFRGDADSPPVPPLRDPASQASLRCPLSWEIKTLFVSVIGCFIPNGLRRGSKAVFLTADAKDD